MVSERGLAVKIDRASGTIKFAGAKTKTEVLNQWSARITKMLRLMEVTCQVIQKETQLQNAFVR